MDTRPFDILFSTLAEISGLNFEIWDGSILVYSTRHDGSQPDLSCESEALSALIIKEMSFQTIISKNGHIIAGVPLRILKLPLKSRYSETNLNLTPQEWRNSLPVSPVSWQTAGTRKRNPK
jgi:hypothetical protein